MDDDPHAPLKADAGVAVPPELLLPVGVVVPATPVLPEGAVGVSSLEVFSKAQPVASADTRRQPSKEALFMIRPYGFVSAHTLLVCTAGRFTGKF
jgi:hypothetical protein